jgi:Tol biopolymer transport system component
MMAIVRMVLAVGGMMVLLLSGVFALWRPEAAEAAWMVYATRASRGAEIIRMSADGTNQARIARLPLDDVSDLEWSSSGAWIVFNGITFSNQNIHRIQPTGRNLQQLTHSEHASFNAVWSPNGQLIAYILSDYADRVKPTSIAFAWMG